MFLATCHSISLAVSLRYGEWGQFVVSFFFAALTIATAEYSRRLLDELSRVPLRRGIPRRASSGPAQVARPDGGVPQAPVVRQDHVPVVAAVPMEPVEAPPQVAKVPDAAAVVESV